MNQKLFDLCKDPKYARFATFLDVHTFFDERRNLFKRDGRHLNWHGTKDLAQMVQKHFLSVGKSKGIQS